MRFRRRKKAAQEDSSDATQELALHPAPPEVTAQTEQPPESQPRPRRERHVIVLATLIVFIQLVTVPALMTMEQRRLTADADQGPAEGEPDPEPEIAPQRFSGSRHDRTEPFPIEGGLVVFHIEHDGGGNFIVVLEDEDGNRVDGLINEIGSFEGSTATHVEEGTYVISLRALSDWSVRVEQPRYASGEELPVSFDDDQSAATEAFEVDEATTVEFTFTHEGQRNIIVRLLDRDGQRVASILNAQGSVDTTLNHEIEAGIYLLDVRADGPWTIDIE